MNIRGTARLKKLKRARFTRERKLSSVSHMRKILRGLMPELTKQYGVRAMGIFGSYVKGVAVWNSDVDILVDFSDPPSLFGFVELRDRLSEVLGHRVDLVMKEALKAGIGERIMSEVVAV